MRFIFFYAMCFFVSAASNAQKLDIGIYYGRFYAIYKYVDYGTGFRNLPGSQYSVFPSIVLNKKYSNKISAEIRASFMDYQQYTGTKLYTPGFYSRFRGGNVSLTANYSFVETSKLELRIKTGLGIGLVPDMYEGTFIEMFVYPYVDSISRGNIKRNYTPVFPTLSTGLDISYKIARRFKIDLAANYQKGFGKITEYDIYYNDGSGNNDQQAKQWGAGDFYGVQLGLRYLLKDENGNRFDKKGKK